MDADGELARAAARGDARAFTRLVRAHEAAVRNMLDRLCGGAGRGDDLAQESFLRAWRLGGSYRGIGSYRSWLLRIAWRTYLTKADRHPPVAFDAERHGGRYERDPAAVIDLERAFALLPARDVAVAVLCFGEGCSHGEAAAILGLPLGTVKSVVARSRRRMTAYLEHDHD